MAKCLMAGVAFFFLLSAVAVREQSLPKLYSDGKYIRDDQGRVVLLRGANVPGHTYDPFTFGEEDLEALDAFGFNAVRLGISWAKMEPVEGHYNREYLAAIKEFIRLAGEHGQYVMPEVHQLGWCSPGSDVPPWMCGRPADSVADFGGIVREARRFWATPELQDKFIGFWKMLVIEFRGFDNLIGYEAMNEPVDISMIFPGSFENKYLFPFYDRWQTAVRELDPDRMLIVDAPVWDMMFPASPRPLAQPNVVFSPHPYFLHVYSAEGRLVVIEREGKRGLRKKYDRLAREGAAMNAPVLIGEFGGPESIPFAAAWLDETLQLQDQYFLGALIWVCDPNDRYWGIVDKAKQPKPFFLSRLRRPYPRATAGTPQELKVDINSGYFSFRYHADQQISAPTEIFVPKEWFDAVTSIEISNGKGTYDREREIWSVTPDPGQSEIAVVLKSH